MADYVLERRDDVPLAVVEAKRTRVDAAAGIEQAKRAPFDPSLRGYSLERKRPL